LTRNFTTIIDREKLQTSLERFFQRLPVENPVIRNNYFIQVVKPDDPSVLTGGDPNLEDDITCLDPEELSWSTTTNGPEEDYIHGHHAHPHTPPKIMPSTLRLRTERQTLRRLPRSGAIVFTIRTYLFKVDEEIGNETSAPGRLASAVRSWPEDVNTYKGSDLYREVLLEYLDDCYKDQVRSGAVGEGSQPVNYPL
jgi:hypothetical protein